MTRHRKQYVVFVHSELDDLPLTPEAFRVYCHLVRRAGRDGEAFPSFTSIARHCFAWNEENNPESARSKCPKSDSARQMAIKAIKELKSFNLVTVEPRLRANGAKSSNEYVVTHVSEWSPPGGSNRQLPGVVTANYQGGYSPATRVVTANYQGSSSQLPAIYEGTPQEGTPQEGTPFVKNAHTREKQTAAFKVDSDFRKEEEVQSDPVVETDIIFSSGHTKNSGEDQFSGGVLQNEVQQTTKLINYEDAGQCRHELTRIGARTGGGYDPGFLEAVRQHLNKSDYYKGKATIHHAQAYCKKNYNYNPSALLAIAQSALENPRTETGLTDDVMAAIEAGIRGDF